MDARAAEGPKAGGSGSQSGRWELSDQHVQEMRRVLQEQQGAVRQLLADWTEQMERRRQTVPPLEKDGVKASAIETMPPILEVEGARQQGSSVPGASTGPTADTPLASSRADAPLPCSVEEVDENEATLILPAQHRPALPSQKDAGDQDPAKGNGDPAGVRAHTDPQRYVNSMFVDDLEEMSDSSDYQQLSNLLEDFRRNLGNVGTAFEKSLTTVFGGRGALRQTGSMRKGGISSIVHGMKFKMFTTFVIGLNAFTIGYEVDESLQRGYTHRASLATNGVITKPDHWQTIEICFAVYFAMELFLRFVAERLMFFLGKEKFWNLFDMFLVLSSLVGVAMSGGDYTDFSFARILRLIRISRVLRILRAMRFSESLRVMVFSVLSSLMSLLWVLLLMFFVIYFFTILFLTAVTDALVNDPTLDVGTLTPYYESLVETVLHMFMSISGGTDWETMANPLRGLHPAYMVIFAGYIFFMMFGLLNVVVGIFVENAKQQQEKDREIVTQTGLKQEKQNVRRMRDIFKEADKDHDGTLSWDEFEEYIQDSEVAAFFGSLGLDVSVARALFVLLDVDDSDAVNIDEFVYGCLRLRGNARSIDVNMLLYKTEKTSHQLMEFMETMEHKLSQIGRELKLPHNLNLEQVLRPDRRARSPRLASILNTPEMSANLNVDPAAAGPSRASASTATRRAGASTSPRSMVGGTLGASSLMTSPTTDSLDMRVPGSVGISHNINMST